MSYRRTSRKQVMELPVVIIVEFNTDQITTKYRSDGICPNIYKSYNTSNQKSLHTKSQVLSPPRKFQKSRLKPILQLPLIKHKTDWGQPPCK